MGGWKRPSLSLGAAKGFKGRIDMEELDGERAGEGLPERGDARGSIAHEAPPFGLTVRRERLLGRLSIDGRDAGITIVNAPAGFGKTALLVQYAKLIREDPSRGVVRLIDAQGMDEAQLGRALQACGEELEPAMRPLVVVDGLPLLKGEAPKQLAILLRALRERDFELVLSCRPDNTELIGALGDSAKIGAQFLTVQPGEYSDWARTFSISSALDVYELTQGVPALVVQLRNVTGAGAGTAELERTAADLYRGILGSLRSQRDPLYRLLCYLLLMGRGAIADIERAGLRVRQEFLSRLARDYPVFGYNADARTFSCMAFRSEEMAKLRGEIAKARPAFPPQAVRILMRANRVDDAVALMEQLLDTTGSLEIINQFPVQFALSGNAVFVHQMASRLNGEDLLRASVGVVLAVYLAALSMGEYRLARAMCATLRRRANELEDAVDVQTWGTAKAFSKVWEDCSGVDLPELSEPFERPALKGDAALLRAHLDIYRELIERSGDPASSLYPEEGAPGENELDLVRLLLSCDRMLDDALHHVEADAVVRDQSFKGLVEVLEERHLAPFAARVRMVWATCRLLLGEPVSDERAFVDAGTAAVRVADIPTQLFCLLGEGWQSIATSQIVNARFRAQQVLKLVDESQGFLRGWALLLERIAYLLNTSQVGIREEAGLLDLAEPEQTPATAWALALHLSAARFDSELSAWYSLHKDVLLDVRFCPMARLALHSMGERADSIRRLLPRSVAARYLLSEELVPDPEPLFDVGSELGFSSIGQVNISLFGGFRVERNGHVLTDEVWKRKKSSVLAARLALSLGSFVSRRILAEELWPKVEYSRARESLYVTLSALRMALGQQDEGLQYVLTQGEGLALNTEFVTSDTGRFDLLAREILLKRAGVTGRQIIESCLKMEQLYVGPLYVPDTGDATFFLRMRSVYLSRFVDCMLRGIEIAIEDEDLHAAAWMVEAALRQAPAREDVVRAAMRVYDLSGRRREVVELYNSHSYYLEHELRAVPDDATREAYEDIIRRSRLVGVV